LKLRPLRIGEEIRITKKKKKEETTAAKYNGLTNAFDYVSF